MARPDAKDNGLLVINKPKKIMVATSTYPPETGGRAVYAKFLKDGWPKVSGDKVRAIILNAGRFRRWPKPFWPILVFFRALYLARFCDAVYCLDYRVASFVRPAAKLLKLPFWLKLDAQAVWEATHGGRPLDDALKSADLVVIPSEILKENVRLAGIPDDRIVLSPNAYDTPDNVYSKEAIRQKWRVTGKIFLSAGVLDERKGIYDLLSVWQKILDYEPEAKLLIAGDGPEKTRLETLIKSLGIEDSVYLAGLLSREELPVYLRMCDVFVRTSLFEASSQMLLEARALGSVIAASESEDNKKTLEKYPPVTWFDPGDRDSLGEALLAALSHSGSREAVRFTEEIALVKLLRRFLDEL